MSQASLARAKKKHQQMLTSNEVDRGSLYCRYTFSSVRLHKIFLKVANRTAPDEQKIRRKSSHTMARQPIIVNKLSILNSKRPCRTDYY